jgi:hypothetical protein
VKLFIFYLYVIDGEKSISINTSYQFFWFVKKEKHLNNLMKSYNEFMQTAANIAGATAGQILQQLDPQMKAQWDKIVTDFPRLFAFLTDLNKISSGTWKITPAQFTQILNKHLTGVARGLQTAPLKSV